MAELVPQTITVYRGEHVTIPFAFSPVQSIVGHTIVFTVTKAINKSVKVLGPLAVTPVDTAVGTFHVILDEDQTNLTPATYAFDVWRTDEGNETPKVIGSFIILGSSRVPPTEVV